MNVNKSLLEKGTILIISHDSGTPCQLAEPDPGTFSASSHLWDAMRWKQKDPHGSQIPENLQCPFRAPTCRGPLAAQTWAWSLQTWREAGPRWETDSCCQNERIPNRSRKAESEDLTFKKNPTHAKRFMEKLFITTFECPKIRNISVPK